MSAIRCPRCGRDDCLFEDVEVMAWIALDPDGNRTTKTGWNDRALHDEAWEGANATGAVGCGNCGWEGVRSDLNVDAGRGARDALPATETPGGPDA